AQASVPVLVFAHTRRGLRPPAAIADGQEAPPARDPRGRANAEGNTDRRVGHQAGDARRRAQTRRASRGLLPADGARLAGSGAEEGGRERDTGARITKALKGKGNPQATSPLPSPFDPSSSSPPPEAYPPEAPRPTARPAPRSPPP